MAETFWTLLDSANKDVRHIVRRRVETYCGGEVRLSNLTAKRLNRDDLARRPDICRPCLSRLTSDN
jgi:hypothetical protein